MNETETWGATIAGMAEGLQRLYALGIYGAQQTAQECDRLLNHEKGCPEDVAVSLRELRRRVTAHLQ